MRTPKTIRLRSANDLKSNKVEDIKNELRLLYEELDRYLRLLWQDVATIQVDADGFVYFGNKDTDGTWRMGRDGVDWVLEHRESGTWTTVDTAAGS